jgi:hypothetical protein
MIDPVFINMDYAGGRAGVPAVSLRAEVRQLTCAGPYRIRNPERTADCRCEKTGRAQPGRPL